MDLSETVRRWIEEVTGGRIVRSEQQVRWREQHFVTVETDDGTLEVLTRSGRDPRIVKHSELLSRRDIDHEARVLQALQGQDVRVPRLLGFHEEERIILMERLPGSNLLAELPDEAARQRVLFQYYDELAKLHALDVGSMAIEGLQIPATPEELAFAGKYAFNERAYVKARPSLQPDPLLDLGRWWLRTHVPKGPRPVAFVQGDTGPGQFMFDGDRLTGLIDWELAHIGDPMLDLGVARMRNMLYPAGSIRSAIAHYDEVTGGTVDWEVLRFYTVLAMVFTPLGIAPWLQRTTALSGDLLARYEWDITLRRGMCDALAEALDIELVEPDLPAPPDGPAALSDLLVDQLETNVAPLATSDLGRNEVRKAVGLARALQLDARIGAELLAADLDDMAEFLGHRPADRADGLAALGRVVDEDPTDALVDLVRLFARLERRREHLWRPMMQDSAAGAFERLSPRDRQ